jgi:hypothetical protein
MHWVCAEYRPGAGVLKWGIAGESCPNFRIDCGRSDLSRGGNQQGCAASRGRLADATCSVSGATPSISIKDYFCHRCLGFRLDHAASVQQCFENFGVIEEQTVIDPLLIVGSQFCQCIVVGNKMKPTREGRVIVDDFALSVLLGEEDAFVIGSCTGQALSPRLRGRRIGWHQGGLRRESTRCETIATTTCTLSAIHVNLGGSLGECPFGRMI